MQPASVTRSHRWCQVGKGPEAPRWSALVRTQLRFRADDQQNRYATPAAVITLRHGERDNYVPCCGLIDGEEDRAFEVKPLEHFE